MPFDFTLDIYKKLILEFQEKGYSFQTFSDFLKNPLERVVMLRHDVDRLPENSLKFAQYQAKLGIFGTYYIRTEEASWNEKIIREISSLGHEIGYHYENLSSIAKDMTSMPSPNNLIILLNKSIVDFQDQLERLRSIVPVETICMHGSPKSIFDNKELWKQFDYSDYGIIGEPYFDINFEDVFYLTDTGRRWDGYKVSIRDKINGYQKKWEADGLSFNTTYQLIKALQKDGLPPKIMITFHPQRWNNFGFEWCKELLFQRIKNPIKRGLIYYRNAD